MINTKKHIWLSFLLIFVLLFSSCGKLDSEIHEGNSELIYNNVSYALINDNVPQFEKDEITTDSFEKYSELDDLGRCGVAFACVGKDIMPTEERGAIGQIKPSGWQISKYDIVDGKYLYNRCHLIGYQLTGENANERNLITGTRSMNVDGMLPFENMVDDYIDKTNNHVMYRVTPVFEGDNLLAKGVQMEAYSVEDEGKGVSFNVFVFNAQPGIEIDYADGKSRLIDKSDDKNKTPDIKSGEYVLNTNTKKIHYKDCPSVSDIQPDNKESYNGTKEYLIENGYKPCGRCKP